MSADPPTLHCLRWTVFIVNLLIWLAGMGVLGVSIWLLFDADYSHVIGGNTGLNDYYIGVYILLGVGLVMTFLGFFGCCGALRKSQLLLTIFFILLLVVFIAELVCSILMYYYQEEVRKYVDDSMLDAIKNHYGTSPYTEAVDSLQTSLQCCGARSYTNWLHSKYVQGQQDVSLGEHAELGSLAQGIGFVPYSCCTARGKEVYKDCGKAFNTAPLHTFVNKEDPDNSFIYPKGCNQALYDYYYDYSNVIIGVAVGVGCFQLVAMVLTMLLCCWISNEEREYSKTPSYE